MKKYFVGVLDPKDQHKVPELKHKPSPEFFDTLRKFSCTWMQNNILQPSQAQQESEV